MPGEPKILGSRKVDDDDDAGRAGRELLADDGGDLSGSGARLNALGDCSADGSDDGGENEKDRGSIVQTEGRS
jgi:hypothetical protein